MSQSRKRGRPLSAKRKPARGFIFLEVIVAMTLLALILTPLAGMVFTITARSHQIIGGAYRNGVLMESVNLLESLPFDSLKIGATVTTNTAKPYPYTKTVTVSLVSQVFELKAKKVILVIAPTNPLYKPDTTTFVRSSANGMTSLNQDDPPPS
jgi:hypothetical protein